MIQQHSMTSMHNSIPHQNTLVRSPLVTTKSPRRGSNRRLYNFSSHPFKTRRLWYDTNLNHSRPTSKKHSIPVYYTLIMRHSYNQLNLSSSNRPQIINCLLICQPYSFSHCSYYDPNTMKLYRSNHSNNCPWLNFLTSILPSKY